MEEEELRQHIARFYEGRTTEGEEETLRWSLTGGDAPGRFAADKAYFLAASRCHDNAERLPDGMDDRLDALIDGLDRNTRRVRVRIVSWAAAAAASVVLIASLWLSYGNNDSGTVSQDADIQFADTYENPKDAYATAEQELVKFSQIMNKGLNIVNN